MRASSRIVGVWVALGLFSASALDAQDIAGSWQGSLQNPTRRIVVKIAHVTGERLTAAVYSVDSTALRFNATSAVLRGSSLRIEFQAIGVVFEGALGEDRNVVTGTWTQAASQALSLTRATPETAWTIPDPPLPPRTMAADADPSFEVATIKPSVPGSPGMSILAAQDGTFTTTNTTIKDLIKFTFRLHEQQITGGPGWLETEKFDITAKPDSEGMPDGAQLRSMVRKLLAERFQFRFHLDKKELSAFTMRLAGDEPRLAPSDASLPLPGFTGRGIGNVSVRNATLFEWASYLQANILDRPVIDETGIAGRFDFAVLWRPEQLAAPGPNTPAPPADLEARPDFFEAVRVQLGLKIEVGRFPVDVMTVENIGRPSEN